MELLDQVDREPIRSRRLRRHDHGHVKAFARPPDAKELADSLKFLDEQGKQRGAAFHPQAWADLCHVLFNVKEFIFVN